MFEFISVWCEMDLSGSEYEPVAGYCAES